jgi:hypothetical protein
MGGYVELWQGATRKLSEGTYRSDDLLDDWFRWCGMVARDTTAAATLLFRLPTDSDGASATAAGDGEGTASPAAEPNPDVDAEE